jgi:hypothetical protein
MVSRRRLLSGAAAGLAALAGCVRVGYVGPTGSDRFLADLPVPESDLVRGTPRDAIPAITDPAFGPDWSGVSLVARTVDFGPRRIEPRPAPFDRVVGLVRDGRARAYPLRVLGWHEVVNDHLGEPLLVSYCPLCGSAVVARRRIAGTVRTFGGSGSDATGASKEVVISFGVSGLLRNDNLVMYDADSDSLWSQVAATAVRGPLTGTDLDLVPSTLAGWDEWRAGHPDTEVLLPSSLSGTVVGRSRSAVRDYTFDPYGAYESNDRVGGVPVLVALTPGGSLVAYERAVDGRPLEFRPGGANGVVLADGSRWCVATGEAVDGPHEGTTLARANDRPAMFWFSWADFHPETAVYGDEG